MVHQVFNDAFEALLAGWHRHMDLVASTDDILKLAESRRQLDALIRRAHRAKQGRKPGEGELGDAQLTAYCPFLATTVYLPKSRVRQTPHDTVEFECACEREIVRQVGGWGADVKEPVLVNPQHGLATAKLRRLRLVSP